MGNAEPIFIGIDIGTGGVRASAINTHDECIAFAQGSFAGGLTERRDPSVWWALVATVLDQLLAEVDRDRVCGIAVDGTSGTVVATDSTGNPLAPAKLYNDRCDDDRILAAIRSSAPMTAPVHGAASALARCLELAALADVVYLLHEADWIASQLTGRLGVSDENNSLKSGYDPTFRAWPDWLDETGLNRALLPEVIAPGTPLAPLGHSMAQRFGLSLKTQVVAGTTDGCASFLATGAANLGDAVSVLGTTLTVKVLTDAPIVAPEYGIYSHRIGDLWLVGGASNTGGGVLAHYFSAAQLQSLSRQIDPTVDSSLDYYPLVNPGERFPINDADLPPRVTPRPIDDGEFLHGLLQGIASIEALAYERIQQLGGPQLKSLRSVGGGASNSVWTRIRERRLGLSMSNALSGEAATGVALLARRALS